MKRFLICGGQKFNNYYLFRKYVKEYIEPDAILVTCGGVGGTDAMSREFADKERLPIEEYPITHNDKESALRRNMQILNYCQSGIIFDDGSKGTVEHLKSQLMITTKSVAIVEIRPEDNIDCNIDCTNSFLKEYFDMCKKSEYSISNLADIVMAILFHEEILKNILDAKDSEFIKSDTLNMAAGFAYWMKHNAVPYIKQRLAHDERRKPNEHIVPLEDQVKIWTNKEHPCSVSTKENLPILNDFLNTVVDGRQLWLEANDQQIIKKNIWQTREELHKNEDRPINSYYETKDNSNTKVFYRNTEFDASPFRAGLWYVDTLTLK